MISFPGGKSGAGVYQSIINQMPPHDIYIETFLGSGGIMRRKLPAKISIGIDIDPDCAAKAARQIAFCNVQCVDSIEWLSTYQWTGRELVYCDPPYLFEARRYQRPIYDFELDEAGHVRLLEAIKRLPCMVLISGYASALYEKELAGWRLVTFTGQTRGRPAIEHLWCNFPPPAALHDYRYLGTDFRERERIGRKARRWRSKLDGLAPLERQAVLSACLAVDPRQD
jgi:DNA adenine methylase